MFTVCPPIVRFVVREEVEPLLDAAETAMLPLPVPEVGDTVAHELELEAVQLQLGPLAVTAITPPPPIAPYGVSSADVSTVTLQARPCWTTVNNCPPTEKDPVRDEVVEFGLTE